MSAYYLRQVVRDWSLANIYHGMFQFMILQVIASGAIVAVPGIATWFPERLLAASRAVVTEEVKDGASLEDYQQGGGYGEALREALEDARSQDSEEEDAEGSENQDEGAPAAK